MLPAASPNDPVFFLNHCNIDRVWEAWMKKNGRVYLPDQTAPATLKGHRINDQLSSLIFYGPPGTGKTSLVSALGGKFGMSIYSINLAQFNDRSLVSAMKGCAARGRGYLVCAVKRFIYLNPCEFCLPIGELRRIFEWFRPLLPYYSKRPYNPRLPRDDRWREQQR